MVDINHCSVSNYLIGDLESSFSCCSVSDYLMGDLESSFSEKEKEDKTKVFI